MAHNSQWAAVALLPCSANSNVMRSLENSLSCVSRCRCLRFYGTIQLQLITAIAYRKPTLQRFLVHLLEFCSQFCGRFFIWFNYDSSPVAGCRSSHRLCSNVISSLSSEQFLWKQETGKKPGFHRTLDRFSIPWSLDLVDSSFYRNIANSFAFFQRNSPLTFRDW